MAEHTETTVTCDVCGAVIAAGGTFYRAGVTTTTLVVSDDGTSYVSTQTTSESQDLCADDYLKQWKSGAIIDALPASVGSPA